MDHSIMTIARAKSLAYARKVDQHSTRTAKGLSTSLAHNTALTLAERTVCGDLCTNELATVLLNRMDTTNGLDFVDKHTLFKLWIAVDTELQARKEALENALVPLVEDTPTRSPYASCVGVDDADVDPMELEAWAVRNIHAEVLEEEEF